MEIPTDTSRTKRPHFGFLHHVSLACRDLAESKKFYLDVLGGELFHDTPGFSEVLLAGMIIGMSEQASGWTGWDDEYPHYGFNVDGRSFALAKPWLDACGVPNYGWTRNYKTALRYFRDPSGNLFEIYCGKDLAVAQEFPRGAKQGGSYVTDYGSLFYDWQG